MTWRESRHLAAVALAAATASACLLPSFDDVRTQAGSDASPDGPVPEGGADALGDGGLFGCDDISALVIWPMTEGVGSKIRDCNGKYPGTFNGNVSWTTGRNGLAALQFSGGSVSIVDDAALRVVGPFSVAAWIAPSSTQTDQFGDVIARYESISTAAWDLTVTQDPSVSLTLFSGNITQATAPIAFDKWVHVVGVYDAGNASIFVNGNVVQSGPGPTSLPPIPTPITLGANAVGTSVYHGKLAGLRIYTRVLTSGEVKTLASK